MPEYKLKTPAGYVPLHGIGFEAADGTVRVISEASPLPVASRPSSAPPPVLTGQTASNLLAGPFSPALAIPILVVLSGNWQGSATLLRSLDGGATLSPLTLGGTEWGRFSGNVCEPVWEENNPSATLYLSLAVSSGTLAYRLGH